MDKKQEQAMKDMLYIIHQQITTLSQLLPGFNHSNYFSEIERLGDILEPEIKE